MEIAPILLCSDLDRTLLPNGAQPESPRARELLRAVAAHPAMHLAYVSGRHLALLREAVEQYAIPLPDFAIGDVGTTIYEVNGSDWTPWDAWHAEIAGDWMGLTGEDLAELLGDLAALELQEPEKQNSLKLSYYTPADTDREALLRQVRDRLAPTGARVNLIWSVDETSDTGLLDVLPASANKLHAIQFLMCRRGFSPSRTVFAGDSGNDLPVLVSPLQSVLVANATGEVRREAEFLAQTTGLGRQLYLARGGFLDLNGNYSAGVLEGLAHYLPETRAWMEATVDGR